MTLRAVVVITTAALLWSTTESRDAAASQPFSPTLSVTTADAATAAVSDLHTVVTVPAGQHAIATWSLQLPLGWELYGGEQIPTGDTVARGTISMDLDCNGSVDSFGPFGFTSEPPDPDYMAVWTAQITPWWTMALSPDGNAGQGFFIDASLVDVTQMHSFCGPETIAIAILGRSAPGNAAVIANPGSPGDYQWTGAYVSMGAEHTANATDITCVGTACPAPIAAIIDLKPDAVANYVDLGRPAIVPMAVLTTPDLNAIAINPASITLEDAPAMAWGARDIDGDSDQDMVFHFMLSQMTVTSGQSQACAQGALIDGGVFSDCDGVQIVPPGSDVDGDSLGVGSPPAFADDVEASLGTDASKGCDGPNAWPPDVNGDGAVTVSDVLGIKAAYSLSLSSPGYSPRLDLSFDGTINITDVLTSRPFFGVSCAAAIDTDGDTLPDSTDTDDDNDTFTDTRELFMGTDPLRDCAVTPAPNDEPIDALPPDFDDDRSVSVSDVLALKPAFGNPDAYQPRYDLDASGAISISDVLTVKSFVGTSC